MIRKLIFAAVVFQILALVGMVVQREYIIHSGKEVYLQTAPIDPRDIFRGDYVRLDYTMLTVPVEKSRDLPKEKIRKGQRVYAVLRESAYGIYAFEYLTGVRPQQGVFIAGRINQRRYGATHDVIRVKYGIEKFFLEQDSGLALEKERGSRNDFQRPMEIKLAVGDSGTAIIKGFRWTPLSIKLTINRQDRNRDRDAPPVSPILSISLKNASTEPVAILNFGDLCAFKLAPDERRPGNSVLTNHRDCMDSEPAIDDVITLAPDEEYKIEINLNRSRWHLFKEDKLSHIAELDRGGMYRIHYNTEEYSELTASVPNLWLGRLSSQAFNSGGRID